MAGCGNKTESNKTESNKTESSKTESKEVDMSPKRVKLETSTPKTPEIYHFKCGYKAE